jgi:hypothetical protein
MLQQQKLVLGGVSAAAGFRYFRMHTTAVAGGPSISFVLTNFELRIDGVDQIPSMLSNTAPSPVVISASKESGGNSAFHAVDDNAGTFGWAETNFSNPGFYQVDFGAGASVLPDTLAIKNHTGNTNTSPTEFQLWGANVTDFSVKTILTDQTGLSWSAGETKTFTLSV